jgi:hypothetical protein
MALPRPACDSLQQRSSPSPFLSSPLSMPSDLPLFSSSERKHVLRISPLLFLNHPTRNQCKQTSASSHAVRWQWPNSSWIMETKLYDENILDIFFCDLLVFVTRMKLIFDLKFLMHLLINHQLQFTLARLHQQYTMISFFHFSGYASSVILYLMCIWND